MLARTGALRERLRPLLLASSTSRASDADRVHGLGEFRATSRPNGILSGI